jgi:uncharacterized hydrophobic protein (TIGR00271 family)
MRDELLFDGPDVGRKLGAFWVLLALSAVIASAGIIADSTATVIGAMIVAPLMTPILGTVLSIVSADARNLARSLVLIVTGAALVIAVGWVLGGLAAVDVVADTNSQVAGRVHPRTIDLVAAIATGAVGAFALARSDVSDTLPGVAIAISLVPPLAVVGLTLEAGNSTESLGALVLFMTNVGAILLSGLVVMAIFRVFQFASDSGRSLGLGFKGAQVAVVIFVVGLTIPLGASTVQYNLQHFEVADVEDVAQEWSGDAGWEVVRVEREPDGVYVRVSGQFPEPDPLEFRQMLDDAGLEGVTVNLSMVPETRVDLPGS